MSDQRIICPVHGMPDCGPLLNGCNRVIELHKAADAAAAKAEEESDEQVR